MTIKVEREALLRVLERPSSSAPIPDSLNDYCVVDYCIGNSSLDGSQVPVEKLRNSTCAREDDDSSVDTSSTASFSDTDSEYETVERRVSFSQELVSDVFTRPYTSADDISRLYYSAEETKRFREEYRLERKVLSELSIDPTTFPLEDTELSDLVAASCSQPSGKHSISRVVVLHNDKLETFFTPPQETATAEVSDAFFDNDSFWSGSITWY